MNRRVLTESRERQLRLVKESRGSKQGYSSRYLLSVYILSLNLDGNTLFGNLCVGQLYEFKEKGKECGFDEIREPRFK